MYIPSCYVRIDLPETGEKRVANQMSARALVRKLELIEGKTMRLFSKAMAKDQKREKAVESGEEESQKEPYNRRDAEGREGGGSKGC